VRRRPSRELSLPANRWPLQAEAIRKQTRERPQARPSHCRRVRSRKREQVNFSRLTEHIQLIAGQESDVEINLVDFSRSISDFFVRLSILQDICMIVFKIINHSKFIRPK
jgi:hypothetical protein